MLQNHVARYSGGLKQWWTFRAQPKTASRITQKHSASKLVTRSRKLAEVTTAIVQSAKRSKTLSVLTSLMKTRMNSVMSSFCGGVTMTVTSLMNLSTLYAPSPTTGVSGYFRPPLAPKVNLLQAWYLNPHSSPA